MNRNNVAICSKSVLRMSLAALCSANLCFGAGPNSATPGSDTSVSSSIAKALQEEKQGKPTDRSGDFEKWKASTSQIKDSEIPESVRWQSGELKSDDAWIGVENLGQDSLSENVRNYLELKKKVPLDQAGHRRLAQYCERNKLKDQAASHWYGVLSYDAQNMEARKALGFTNFSNRWVSRAEIITAQETTKSIEDSCKKWLPKVQKWVSAIEGKDAQKRLEAIRELKAVDDPSFVHAARIVTPQVSPSIAAHLVQVIRKFPSRDAAQALASIAVLDLSTTASQQAVEGLKEYPLESYVPDMLDLMATETTLNEQIVTQPNGALVLQMVQEREWRNQRSSAWFDKHLWGSLPRQSNHRSISESSSMNSSVTKTNDDQSRTTTNTSRTLSLSNNVAPPNSLVIATTNQEVNRLAKEAQSRTQLENAVIRERQKNIASILRGVTDANVESDDAREWWAWWDDQQENYLAEAKPVHYGYHSDTTSKIFQPKRLLEASAEVTQSTTPPPPPPSDRPRRHDCLVAGTMVTTELGMVPIEQISIGDRVLSQDIETGELVLKPVLRAATRPPAPTYILKLSSGEEMQCTLGHPWWVLGKGWVKSKDLKPGMHLRTPKSSIEIVEIKAGESVETYNLVVADYSSYFAGEARALSYDGNEVIHTFQTVPGLPAEVKTAKLALSR